MRIYRMILAALVCLYMMIMSLIQIFQTYQNPTPQMIAGAALLVGATLGVFFLCICIDYDKPCK